MLLEEKGEEQGFDSKEYEVVPKVEDVSLVDGAFDGALGGDEDEDFLIGEGVGLDDEALVEAIEEKDEEKRDEDDEDNKDGDHYLINECWLI
nr:hypothetical protein [Tanacetum cinerariifolium]